MKTKLPLFIFIIVVLVASAAIALALVYHNLLGMVVYDYNFETFHNTLTPEQRDGIIRTVRAITDLYVMLLLVTNAVWLAAGWYLLSCIRKREHELPTKSPQATAAPTRSRGCD